MSHRLDLDAYLGRIGHTGPRAPDLATLRALSLAHVSTIPFENLDILLGKGVDVALPAIEAKLVGAGRGGYCFEQNALFLAALTALGFTAAPLAARVRIGRPRDVTTARTHMCLRVELDGASWLVDVGVGAWSLTSPIRLVLDEEQPTAHEPRRLVAEGDWDGLVRRAPDARLFHQIRLGADWQDVYDFTLEPMPEIDRVVGNWYTSTHPTSHFRERLIVARATPTGRLTLADRELTRRGHDGRGEVRVLASADELLAVLADEFGLHLPPGTRFATPGLAAIA